MNRFQEFPTKAAALDQAKAVDIALNLPRRGLNIGNGPHAVIPDVYSVGAIGWTSTECSVEEDPISKTALLGVTDAAVLLGKRDVIANGKTVAIDFTKSLVTEKPAKYKP